LAGWIKLHRKLKNSLVFDNPDLLKVWIWCLLKATHDDYIQMIGLQEVELEKGQFIFGRKVAANELKMSESKTYRLIKKLETMQNLNIKANNKYSIITIENWELYQFDENKNEQQFEQQMNNKRTTNEQQMNTNKNIKNNKNNKNNNNIYSESLIKKIMSYPGKKTKDTRDKKLPQLIKKYGEEQIIRCIERYSEEVKGREKRYILNESTFWNGRYVDYLDVNYEHDNVEEDINKPQKTGYKGYEL